MRRIEKSIANISKTLNTGDKAVQKEACDKVAYWLKNYGVPITGGNLFETIMSKNAIDQAFNGADGDFPTEMTMGHYFELLKQAKYWQNLFIIQNWDELSANNKKALKIAMATLFIYGYIGLYKETDKDGKTMLVPYILTGQIVCDQYGYPIKCDGYPAGMCYQFGIMDFNFKDKTINIKDDKKDTFEKHKKHLDKTNCVFGKWNTWGYGAWLLEMPFINRLMIWLDRINTAHALTGLMLKQKSIDGNSRGAEQILDSRGILTEVSGKEGTFSDKFETMDVGQGGKTLQTLIDSVEWFRQWYYSMNGRRYNINEKQERNINSEVMYSQLNFDVLENEHLRELQIMFQQVKEQFNLDIQVSSPIVADDIENQEDYNKLNSEDNVETISETLNGGK